MPQRLTSVKHGGVSQKTVNTEGCFWYAAQTAQLPVQETYTSRLSSPARAEDVAHVIGHLPKHASLRLESLCRSVRRLRFSYDGRQFGKSFFPGRVSQSDRLGLGRRR